VIIDLHAHYPMHLLDQDTHAQLLTLKGKRMSDLVRAIIMRIANLVGNYESGEPAVTIPNLKSGSVGAALSVLTCPLSEIDLSRSPTAPPEASYFTELRGQIDRVEADILQNFSDSAAVVRNHAELNAALAHQKVALIHAVEGGFHFGADPLTIQANVKEAAGRGVAYITVAHLFFRHVATNAPAIPFLPDWLYRLLFPQPDDGLTASGIALVNAMLQHNVLIDVTHMSNRSLDQTLQLLDAADPGMTVPVMATHVACRFNDFEYNLSDEHIAAIGRRGGVVGLIVCKHWMADRTPWKGPKTLDDSMQIVFSQVDRIREVTGTYDNIAIGTDMDGFIKPALPGLESPTVLPEVENRLGQRYTPAVAKQICWDNASRVLEYWVGGT
jgi:microsomal dipeptidase-like Zn-dependent dipeptidase